MDEDQSETPHLSRKALIGIIGRIREFKGFSVPQLTRIAKLKVEHWGPAEFIIHEGMDDVDLMFILLAGTVYVHKKVEKDGEDTFEQMAEISGPSIIGENSFFTGLSRSAAVFARERVPGIVLNRRDFMRLISLDKSSFLSFLRQIAEENLQRAERTAVLYMGTLQLILKDATMTKSAFYAELMHYRKKLELNKDDVHAMHNIVRDVMLFIRELNLTLEDLYQFANLPEIKVKSVDFKKFTLTKTHRFYQLFRNLVEDMYQTQQLLPLMAVNFKDSILSSVINSMEQGVQIVEYPKIISISNEVYTEFLKLYRDMGFTLVKDTPPPVTGRGGKKGGKSIIDLLWEDV